ncbi:MAG: DoxX family protein [Pyrinomonadaceae bacterium]|nr:DoxX family protein [Pyrinomonadaceae bacterium]
MSNTLKIISWASRIIVALIFLQTLFFKFTGAEESKYIFTTLMGAEYEAIGRIGSGLVEMIAAILILLPRTVSVGAVLSIGTISGAILSHLTKLGIVVKDDSGALFGLAVVVFVLSLAVVFIHRRELPFIGDSL